jgi:hypothetical protein
MKRTKSELETEAMVYLLAKHRVEDFDKWHSVFESHADAQRKAGLHLLHLFHDTDDPSIVVVLFTVDDLNKARAFTKTPDARASAKSSGVIGVPEILFLKE